MKISKPTGALSAPPHVIERIKKRIVVRENECWEWNGAHTAKGYAETSTPEKRVVYTHRFMYELTYGAIPQNMVIDHKCNNVGCVNPKHLRLLSNAENIWRKYEHTPRTHCRRGHLLEGNSRSGINKRNGRMRRWCISCLNKEY